jgi:hypothetical protein
MHCRASTCPPMRLTGRPNIKSDFRINLMATDRNYYGMLSDFFCRVLYKFTLVRKQEYLSETTAITQRVRYKTVVPPVGPSTSLTRPLLFQTFHPFHARLDALIDPHSRYLL